MTMQELDIQEKNYLHMEEAHLRALSMATRNTEKVFLRSQLCAIRGLQSDVRAKRLEIKFRS